MNKGKMRSNSTWMVSVNLKLKHPKDSPKTNANKVTSGGIRKNRARANILFVTRKIAEVVCDREGVLV